MAQHLEKLRVRSDQVGVVVPSQTGVASRWMLKRGRACRPANGHHPDLSGQVAHRQAVEAPAAADSNASIHAGWLENEKSPKPTVATVSTVK